MKLRTQLILAFVVLAILPLSGIVVYNYLSSLETFRRLVELESHQMTEEIGRNMEDARGSLQRQWEGLGRLRLEQGRRGRGPEAFQAALRQAIEGMGEAGKWFRAFEFIPEHLKEGGEPFFEGAQEAIEQIEQIELKIAEGEIAPPADWWPRTPVTIRMDEEEAPRLPPVPGLALRSRDQRNQIEREQEKIDEKLEALSVELEEKQTALEEAIEADADLDQDELIDQEIATFEVAKRIESLRGQSKRLKRLLGTELSSQMEGMGSLHAQINLKQFFRRVLLQTQRDNGEVPFVADEDGELYTISTEDAQQLRSIAGANGLDDLYSVGSPYTEHDGWFVATREDGESGVIFGIARPIADSIAEMQSTSARNLLLGVGMIGLSLLGILPLSGHMSRRLKDLTAEANRFAAGDLDTRVPAYGRDEIGQLARAFNSMAGDLQQREQQLLRATAVSKEQDVQRRLLERENARRGEELEEARSFQLSMLPGELPRSEDYEIAVFMKTATEVGGDYYDFSASDGALTVAFGDATGHGARAGTMVTVIKTLFASRGGERSLTGFLEDASRSIKSMDLDRMTMALGLVRMVGDELEVASAGMPPVLVRRGSTGEVEEVAIDGLPLGAMSDASYRSSETSIGEGDTVLLMSDGFPELLDQSGEPIGYGFIHQLFSDCGGESAQSIIDHLAGVVSEWTGGAAPSDDVTFVIIGRRGAEPESPTASA